MASSGNLAYVKMHGAGNDFIMIDGRQGLPGDRLEALAALLCDRRRGLGADGIVVLYPELNGADFAMRYVNGSGLPGEMCGNARAARPSSPERSASPGARRPSRPRRGWCRP